MELQTRPPTCVVPFPMILIEGPADSGKSWQFVELSASPLVGRSLLLDLGDGCGDEYGDAVAADQPSYDLIVHDGTWSSIIGQVQAAHTEAARAHQAGDKPVVLCLDSGSRIWNMLKSWGNARAKGSIKHQRLLAFDPNAEIRIPNNIWDDVHARHTELMDLLCSFPGIVIVTARGREMFINEDSGDPVPKSSTYKVDCHRDLTHAATVWIRLSLDAPPTIVGAQSKYLHVRYGNDEARVVPDLNLADLIFTTLRVTAASQPRQPVQLGRERLPEQIRDEVLSTVNRQRLQWLLTEAAHPAHQGVTVDNEFGAEETLTDLIGRRIRATTSGQHSYDGDGFDAAAPVCAVAQPGRGGQVLQAKANPCAIPAAAEAEPPPPNDKINEPTLAALKRMLADCGVTDPQQRLVTVLLMTGQKLATTRDMTTRMGADVIGMLAPVLGSASPEQALRALLAERLAAKMPAPPAPAAKAARRFGRKAA